MSRIPEPYACDVCGALKKEANHWFIGRVDYAARCATVCPWDRIVALTEVAHLCGLACSQRWLASALEKISQEESHDEHQ